jgi:hypothetical protein
LLRVHAGGNGGRAILRLRVRERIADGFEVGPAHDTVANGDIHHCEVAFQWCGSRLWNYRRSRSGALRQRSDRR